MLKIRKLSSKDLEQVLEVSRASFIEPWSRNDLEKYLAESFVAENDGVIAGFAVCKISDGRGTLKLVAVNPDFRGKGIGKSLMEYIFEYFIKNGVKKVAAHSRLRNEAGCAFLQSCGFKIVKTVENYYRNGESAYLMVKKLDG